MYDTWDSMVAFDVLHERYGLPAEVAADTILRRDRFEHRNSVKVESILKAWIDAGLLEGKLFVPEAPKVPTREVFYRGEWREVGEAWWAEFKRRKREG